MTYDVVEVDTQGHAPSAPKVRMFWVVLDGSAPALPLCVALLDGRKALALFSGQDRTTLGSSSPLPVAPKEQQ